MFAKRGGILCWLFKPGRWGALAGAGAFGFCAGIAVTAAGATVLGGIALPEWIGVQAQAGMEERVAGLPQAVDRDRMAVLVKSTLIAIQQANQTGNYSVLRDLGTPAFRDRFDQARLTAIFARLRNLQVDLSPVLTIPPKLSKEPELTPANRLRLTGEFSTQALQIRYVLAFVWTGDRWCIEGLAIDTLAVRTMSRTQEGSLSEPANLPRMVERISNFPS